MRHSTRIVSFLLFSTLSINAFANDVVLRCEGLIRTKVKINKEDQKNFTFRANTDISWWFPITTAKISFDAVLKNKDAFEVKSQYRWLNNISISEEHWTIGKRVKFEPEEVYIQDSYYDLEDDYESKYDSDKNRKYKIWYSDGKFFINRRDLTLRLSLYSKENEYGSYDDFIRIADEEGVIALNWFDGSALWYDRYTKYPIRLKFHIETLDNKPIKCKKLDLAF